MISYVILLTIAAFAGAMIGYSLSYLDHYKRGYEDGVKNKITGVDCE